MIGISELGSGLEVVQTAMLLQLSDRLDQEIARQQSIWDSYDKFVADRMFLPFEPVLIESVQARSITPGSRMSLLKLPADRFPAVAVMCDRNAPTVEASLRSTAFPFSTSAYAEVIVRSEPYMRDDAEEEFRQEGIVDKRIKRTSQAVVEAIMADRSLGGVTPEIGLPRTVQTDSFALQGVKPDDLGRTRIFSMSRIDFVADVYAGFEESTSSIASSLPPGGLGA